MSRRRAGFAAALALCLASVNTAAAQLFRGPVTCSSCISNLYYLDQGFGRDWNCGSSSYSGHTGSDYSLRNGNRAIDADNEVVAMATGVVVHSEDGYYDRCTQCGGANCGRGFGNGFANQVIINHGPYRVIYGHMKQGSIAVREGDSVECGQVIGFIGSSGCSTGAHLHIEPSLAANFGSRSYTPIDPYAGDCSSTESSLFVDQGAYRSLPAPTCDGSPPVPVCPPDTYEIWTCNADASARRRCQDGMVSEESCAFGCTVMPVGTDDHCAVPPDADGDGSRGDVDCDDEDPERHPGAVEVCGDGIDQACSGGDLSCPVPPPAAGMTGAMPPLPTSAGAAAPGASAGQPSVGQSGQPAPPLGQAGSLAGASAGADVPVWSATPRGEPQSGCGVIAPGTRHPAGMLALLLLARQRRKRSAPCPRARRSSGKGILSQL